MRKVQRNEILDLGDYEQIRERFRARIIEEKRPRRIPLGEHISAVFENHDTALFQIQEMLRTERITREEAVQHEIDTYNDMVPGDGELSATIFVEIPEKTLRDRMLVDLAGLEGCFFLEVDGVRHPGRNETRGVLPDRTTAVHYVKFPLGDSAAKVKGGNVEVALGVDHPKYQARTSIQSEALRSLALDLK
jgi:hypothetical protein